MQFPEIERRYRAGLARYGNFDPGCLDLPGTTIAPVADRRGTKLASAYLIGAHSVVFCDPELVTLLDDLASADDSFSPNEVASWASRHGFEYIGAGWNHLVDRSMLTRVPASEGANRVILDRDNPTDRALITDLVEATSPEEADEADLDLDNLDPFIVALLDRGRIVAYASEKPSEHDEAFADIAVLTRATLRSRGWGRAVVSFLCDEIFDRGRFPLYRCAQENMHSRRLAVALGFKEVVSLAAMRAA